MKRYKYSKEAKIGAAFIIAIIALYFGINFLKGRTTLSDQHTYYVVYNNISGLSPSASINNNGFRVGYVNEIHYDYANPNLIVVELSINKALQIPVGSKAYLMSELLGGVSIDLRLNHAKTFYADGDTIEAGIAHGLMGQVEEEMLPQITSLLPKVDSLIASLNAIANNPDISRSLANVASLSIKLDNTADELNKLFHNELPNLMKNLQGTGENLHSITSHLNTIDYASTMAHVDSTIINLQTLSALLMSDDSSVGRLINDTAFYNNLNSICTNANALIEDVKKHPSRYINISVFGKKN